MPLIKQHRSQHISSPWGRKEGLVEGSPETSTTSTSTPSPTNRSRFGGRRRFVRRRQGQEDERWKKNKKTIDHYVRRMGTLAGKQLSLNADGLAFFAFKKFIVVVEVPEDNAGVCFIYTMVCRLGPTDNRSDVLEIAMELNYMQNGTKGATLGLDGEEVNLCYSCHVAGLSFNDLNTALEDFLLTALEVNERLDSVKAKQTLLPKRSCGSL